MDLKFASNANLSPLPFNPRPEQLEEMVNTMSDKITITSNSNWKPSPKDLPPPLPSTKNRVVQSDDEQHQDGEDEEDEEEEARPRMTTLKKAKMGGRAGSATTARSAEWEDDMESHPVPPPPQAAAARGGWGSPSAHTRHLHPSASGIPPPLVAERSAYGGEWSPLSSPTPPPRSGGGGVGTLLKWLFAVAIGMLFMVGVHLYATHILTIHRRPSASAAFPLWIEPHTTTSHPLNLREPFAKPLLASLEHSFYTHLAGSSTYACLCMHHLRIQPASPGQFQVCAVYNRYMDKVHVMTNPRMVGHGNATDLYEEQSIATQAVRNHVPRFRNVFIEWNDVATGDVLLLQLNGMQAVCMQVALEEMDPSLRDGS